MNFWEKSRKLVAALVIVLTVTLATACTSAPPKAQATQMPSTQTQLPSANRNLYSQLERGNTSAGQKYGDWVVQTSRGLIKDAYVRDNNKLGVVISPQVSPNDVRPLAKSLVQGFQRNFSKQDVSILVYAPDKKLILTAQYDAKTNQVRYQ
ncbi:hypothetical protein [Oscillatoria sp. FACHB-1406]|uniref:hypothetical protein n=1 Tax=Oscillatoria sp. FACHB-1406 TaxID=2692846 RepID=UPI0016850C60|nr:hypothetical protein [Oscillatoria sp. FACHB-1406]MBD2579355.1 hypothetical protein [Oscillatoria sp. FACHB-1406]